MNCCEKKEKPDFAKEPSAPRGSRVCSMPLLETSTVTETGNKLKLQSSSQSKVKINVLCSVCISLTSRRLYVAHRRSSQTGRSGNPSFGLRRAVHSFYLIWQYHQRSALFVKSWFICTAYPLVLTLKCVHVAAEKHQSPVVEQAGLRSVNTANSYTQQLGTKRLPNPSPASWHLSPHVAWKWMLSSVLCVSAFSVCLLSGAKLYIFRN